MIDGTPRATSKLMETVEEVRGGNPERGEQYHIGKTGIIFFKDYWRRENEKTPSGDHIDL